MNRFDLQALLVQKALGRSIETTRPVPMSIEQAQAALWPLHERFRPHMAQVQSLVYDQAAEAAADEAVEQLVLSEASWEQQSPGVWRVLLERHLQVQMLLTLKAAEAGGWDAPFLPVPEPADAVLRAKLAIVFLLHSTPLPFPVVERSNAELPKGNAPGTLTRH